MLVSQGEKFWLERKWQLQEYKKGESRRSDFLYYTIIMKYFGQKFIKFDALYHCMAVQDD